MRGWLRTVTERPVAVGMLTLAGVIFGAIGLGKLPVELLPDITYPSLTVQTELPDASPGEVEQLVTTPIEQVVGVVSGLQRYHSSSRPGVSEITLEFAWGTDMASVSLDVREKLDLVELPDDALSPIVYRFEPSLDPVVRVALRGNGGTRVLRRLADDVVKKKLETVEGVAAAKVIGGAEEEVHVEVDEAKLDALGLSIEDVVLRLQEENVNRSGGELRDDESAYLLRTINEFESLEDIENTIVRDGADGRIRLRDIGGARFGTQEREVRVRVGGEPAIELHVYKTGDANTVQVVRRVRERLAEIEDDRRLRTIEISVLSDQARMIEESVRSVIDTALVGALLAAIVLFVFLRDFRSTLLIALSIPISVAVTFLLMHLAGISLNVMSLGGLALGVGMLVDNSVVVLEAIRRHRDRGTAPAPAAIAGAGEVIGGITASTLTTISVFLPLVFVEGIAGQIFYDQALTVTFALIASLFVAVTVIPCAMARGGGRATAAESSQSSEPSPAAALPDEAAPNALARAYGRALAHALRTPWLAPTVALVLFGLAWTRVGGLGTELVPDLAQGEFYYALELPEGTPIDTTDARVAAMESAARALQESGAAPIVSIHATVGGAPVLGDIATGERLDHQGRLSIRLAEGTTTEEEAATIAQLDDALALIPECPATLGKPSLFSFRDPLEVEVFAPELDALTTATHRILELLERTPGVIEPVSDLPDPSPEYHVQLDPTRLARLGLSQGQVAETLKSKGLGTLAGQFTHYEKPIDIRVQVIGARRTTPGEARRRSVRPMSEEGNAIPLSALGAIELGSGPVEITHVGGDRAARIHARSSGLDLGKTSRAIAEGLSRTLLPPQATARISGQNEEMERSIASLRFALALAVFLVYLVLASNFESLKLPLVIMLTVPLGLIGAIAGLWLTGLPLGVLSMIGVILLAGIVVNNGILFIDRIQQKRTAGLPLDDAIRGAGMERLRPIVITSVTTILGLLPLGLGLGPGAELRQPMAVTVIGGLLVATLLTLFVVPSGFRLLSRQSSSETEASA